MFYLIGIIITFFLAVLLIVKKNKSTPDWILTLWLISTAVLQLVFYLFISGEYYNYPQFLGIERPLPLLQGPFLYIYTATSTRQPVLGKYPALHFAPWLLAHTLLIPFTLLPASEKIYVYQHQGLGYENVSEILVWAITLSGVVYIFLALRLLRQHKRNIEQQFSNTGNISLNWLRYLIYGLGAVWLMVIVGDDKIIFATAVLFVLFLGYFGINQVGIFTQTPIVSNETNAQSDSGKEEMIVESTETKKYQKSGLTEEAAIDLHNKLVQLMADQKLFKNPELTLPELAQKLDVNPNTLSQVINSREGKNFYDYINLLRIADFKEQLQQPESQKYSLLGLATQCGFNSKTTFNRNFKKTTGLSPTEYLAKNNISLQ